jgi:hypothetical protein
MNPCKNCGGQQLQRSSKNLAQYGSPTFSASFVSQSGSGFLFFVHRAVDFVSASPLVCQVKENDFANKKMTERD